MIYIFIFSTSPRIIMLQKVWLLIILMVIKIGAFPVIWQDSLNVRVGYYDILTSYKYFNDPSIQTTVNFYKPMVASGTIQCYTSYLMSFESRISTSFSYLSSVPFVDQTRIVFNFTIKSSTFFNYARMGYLTFNNYNNFYKLMYLNQFVYNWNTESFVTGTGLRTLTYTEQLKIIQSLNFVIKTWITSLTIVNNNGLNTFVAVDSVMKPGTNSTLITITTKDNNKVYSMIIACLILDLAENKQRQLLQVMDSTYTLNNLLTTQSIIFKTQFYGISRIIFGISKFDMSLYGIRIFKIYPDDYANLNYTYVCSTNINQIRIEAIFLAQRECTTLYYEPINRNCVTACSAGYQTITTANNYSICRPCSYRCQACSSSNSSQCTSCDIANLRSGTPNCNCVSGYFDIGFPLCALCSSYIPYCDNCSAINNCINCYPPFIFSSNLKCQCPTNFYNVTNFCLSFPGCLLAYNQTKCSLCDASLNFILQGNICVCMQGFLLNTITKQCYDICGDAISTITSCDDGNSIPLDGCSDTCQIETGFNCIQNIGALSICNPSTYTIKYLYSERLVGSNEANIVFSFSPKSNFSPSSFNNLINSNMPAQQMNITYDNSKSLIILWIRYNQSMQSNFYTLNTNFTELNITTPQYYLFNTEAINAKLIVSQYQHQIYIKVISSIIGVACWIFAFICSLLGHKIMGLELLLPVQTVYFTISCLSKADKSISFIKYLKWSTGYNKILDYDFQRNYNLFPGAMKLQFQDQFLLNFNIMLLIQIACNIIALSFYFYSIKNQITDDFVSIHQTEQDQININQIQKKKYLQEYLIFFIDRIYVFITIANLFQLIFSLFIRLEGNLPIENNYSIELNNLASILAIILATWCLFFMIRDYNTIKPWITYQSKQEAYSLTFLGSFLLIAIVISAFYSIEYSKFILIPFILIPFIVNIYFQPYEAMRFKINNLASCLNMCMLILIYAIFLLVSTKIIANEIHHLIAAYVVLSFLLIGLIVSCIRFIKQQKIRKYFNPKQYDTNILKEKELKEENVQDINKIIYKKLKPDDFNQSDLNQNQIKQEESCRIINFNQKNNEDFESLNKQNQQPEQQNLIQLDRFERIKKRLRKDLEAKKEKQVLKNIDSPIQR